MYLNKAKVLIRIVIYGGLTLYFGGLSFLFLFSMLLGGANQVEIESEFTSEIIAMLVAFLILFVLFIFKLRVPFMAIKISKLFANNRDGLISIEEISNNINKKQDKFVLAFMRCVGKGILVNCGIYAVDPTYIILGNGASSIKEKYCAMKCNCCGATNVNRSGFVNKCKYCGNAVQ